MRTLEPGSKLMVTLEIVRPFDIYQTMKDGTVINNHFQNKYWAKPLGCPETDPFCLLLPIWIDDDFDPRKNALDQFEENFPSGIVSEESSEPLDA